MSAPLSPKRVVHDGRTLCPRRRQNELVEAASNGREITGALADDGIRLVDRTGVTVRNCKITSFAPGMRLFARSGNTLLANTISDCFFGIQLEGDSDGNRITGYVGSGIELDLGGGNVVTENNSSGNGVGIRVSTFDANTIERNTTDSNEADGLDICCEGHRRREHERRG